MTKIRGRTVGYGIGGTVLFLLAIQLVPYGRNHANPPVVREPAWDSPATRALAKRACFDCHSHETVWPWYAGIAPASWLVQHDVDEGRKKLDFSDWTGKRKGENAKELTGEVRKGEMPPLPFRLLHPEARLTDPEKETLIRGLDATAGHR